MCCQYLIVGKKKKKLKKVEYNWLEKRKNLLKRKQKLAYFQSSS